MPSTPALVCHSTQYSHVRLSCITVRCRRGKHSTFLGTPLPLTLRDLATKNLDLGLGLGFGMRYRVRDGLFFGGLGGAAEVLQGGDGGGEVTHVLSLLNSASISFFSEWRPGISIPTKEIRRVYRGGPPGGEGEEERRLLYALELAGAELGVVRMAVPLRDTEDEDLLDFLEACLDFIEQSRREGGSVLVHCFAGVSRSAAVVTAYLMRTEKRSQEDALESLREVCDSVCPNDGFLDQLKMFEEMGFKVDTTHPIYKRFRLKVLGLSYKQGEKVDSSIFGADPGLPPETNSSEGILKKDQPARAFRCRKCRRIIALQENVVAHEAGEGETCFEWQKRRSGNPFNRFAEQECSSIFVEPLRWMTTVQEGALEGKLSCIHCDARLGYFNWSGIQCSCGSWITPAFQIHKSKVDVSTV